MNRGHVPQRTCRGCGRKGPRAGLLRFVVIGGRLVEDQQGGMPGKGVYCCDQDVCRERLAKSKKVLKAD
ncbi:ribosomal protein L7Ae family protein [Desulfobulbus propionicus DSM 2032]|jgi:predicted RNA-binding protein YlxR (DUF448 family)|uniref:Ribosomal protein L7Ae family protein n=1 Tax=Desulfobulbus propionicus (strain ATCC 33891 / DSM 2032 / VKM B-1956 / 1pr3) TaxID=577650 RepID=A0A7U4DQI0_DESPD|nr:ribosomal protein L7Ae family protein [Desulfobulbus propionicus DSM 2032]